jgi:hypothetical protein
LSIEDEEKEPEKHEWIEPFEDYIERKRKELQAEGKSEKEVNEKLARSKAQKERGIDPRGLAPSSEIQLFQRKQQLIKRIETEIEKISTENQAETAIKARIQAANLEIETAKTKAIEKFNKALREQFEKKTSELDLLLKARFTFYERLNDILKNFVSSKNPQNLIVVFDSNGQIIGIVETQKKIRMSDIEVKA